MRFMPSDEPSPRAPSPIVRLDRYGKTYRVWVKALDGAYTTLVIRHDHDGRLSAAIDDEKETV